MATTPKTILYTYFETGDKPTQAQFRAWMDSYFHKSETIPADSVGGFTETITAFNQNLNNHINSADAHEIYLAKKDASNLDADDVVAWKIKLDVGESTESGVDLVKPRFDGEVPQTASQEFLNNAFEEKITAAETAINSGNLGKNIANADLTFDGDHILDYASKNLTKINVPKDNTITTITGKNANNQERDADVNELIVNNFATISPAQAATIRSYLNAGANVGTMSILLISPRVKNNANSNIWITIYGTNLFANPTTDTASVSLMDELGTSEILTLDNYAVTYNVDGDGRILMFTLTPEQQSQLLNQNLKVRIIRNSQQVISSMKFQIVDDVTTVNLAETTWSKLVYNNAETSINYGNANFFRTQTDNNIKPAASDGITVVGLKSNLIFPENSNFYLSMNITLSGNGGSQQDNTRIGVCDATGAVALANENLWYVETYGGGVQTYKGFRVDGVQFIYGSASVYSVDVIMVRTGGVLVVIMSSGTVVQTYSKEIGSIPVSVGVFATNKSVEGIVEGRLIEAYY
jgi:hypothetical protein